jgi:hypothetical protein
VARQILFLCCANHLPSFNSMSDFDPTSVHSEAGGVTLAHTSINALLINSLALTPTV